MTDEAGWDLGTLPDGRVSAVLETGTLPDGRVSAVLGTGTLPDGRVSAVLETGTLSDGRVSAVGMPVTQRGRQDVRAPGFSCITLTLSVSLYVGLDGKLGLVGGMLMPIVVASQTSG